MKYDITFDNFIIGKSIKFLNSSAKIYETHPLNKRIKLYFELTNDYSHRPKGHIILFIRNGLNDDLLNEIKEKYPEELI